MIDVKYNGGLGNNLFQYCFGRILAERLGYALAAPPIPGFAGTYDAIEGASHRGGQVLILRGHKPDLSAIETAAARGRHILVTGYFQRYEHYKGHAADIRRWLRLPDHLDVPVADTDIALSIRRGRDYIPRYGLPLSFYEEALDSTPHGKVFICTNEPRDPFIAYLARKYDAVIRPGAFQGGKLGASYLTEAIDNLVFLKKFRKLVVSNSSFAWWAAFLSDATEIVYPRPSTGMWAPNDPVSKNIDLEVDEARYRYMACAPYQPEFASERLRIAMRETGAGLRSILRALASPLRPARPHIAPQYRFEEE